MTTIKKVGNKGQSIIETVLVLPLVVAALFLVLKLGYQSGLYFMAAYYSEEALLCANNQSFVGSCETNFKQQMLKIIIFKEPLNVAITKSRFKIQLKTQIDVISFERVLKLPLEGNLN